MSTDYDRKAYELGCEFARETYDLLQSLRRERLPYEVFSKTEKVKALLDKFAGPGAALSVFNRLTAGKRADEVKP